MAESSSPKLTPKRKRDDVINEQRFFASDASPSKSNLSNAVFSFQSPSLLQPVANPEDVYFEDGSSSPRSKVAQKFKDLAIEGLERPLEGGGGVNPHRCRGCQGCQDSTSNNNANVTSQVCGHEHDTRDPGFSPDLAIFDFDAGRDMQIDDDDNSTRKRTKFPHDGTHQDIGVGMHGETSAIAAVSPVPLQIDQDGHGHPGLETTVDPAVARTAKSGGTGRLQKSYPSINRLSDSKSRSRKRAGTPPVLSKRKTAENSGEEGPDIVDPIRAALTWHEDEITVYDPEDKDDDGTGINGIGFKPTPAIAYARAQKRRQQLAEYKKREESEAREKRNQRRREHGGAAGLEKKHSIVRVHFSDADPNTMVTT
ncbi:hypothetical protein F4779DRAFT_516935 [Xylariaceae sp. FL0662B]|nr:hypothetical protein F4779DRAFT_516935 [Xylariaceae sp. FL0662B]